MNTKIPQVIIVDDHPMFREGIRSLIDIEGMGEVIAEASNGKEFLRLLNNYHPELVLMDIDMPEMNGIDACKRALELRPDLNILGISMFGDEKYYMEMIDAGAKGFLLKTSDKNELEFAIREVISGRSYFSNDLLKNFISKVQKSTKEKHPKLTHREEELVQLLCQGLSTIEIADKLCLSAKTVENYRVKLLHKMNCKNSVHLVVYAIKNGLVQI